MNNADKAYNDLCRDILANGVAKEDRTGTGTLSVFGRQLRFDLSEGFPLLTGKLVPFRLIAEELLFFIKGKTNLKDLLDKNVDIWTRDGYAKMTRENAVDETLEDFRELAGEYGYDLGPIYGSQWRSWPSNRVDEFDQVLPEIDQLEQAIENLKYDPNSRRMIVSAWNPPELDGMALPPCHIMFQLYCADGRVSLQMYQRSSDVFLGLPFNIASYALLLEMIAQVTGYEVGELIITLGDAHIYSNHIAQVEKQITREPRELPRLYLDATITDIDDFEYDHMAVLGYEPHPAIKGAQSF